MQKPELSSSRPSPRAAGGAEPAPDRGEQLRTPPGRSSVLTAAPELTSRMSLHVHLSAHMVFRKR